MSISFRSLAIFFFACLFTTALHAQSSVVYGSPNADEQGYEVIPTNDGGYMVGGQYTDASQNVQFWVVKVNAKGAVAWDTVYHLGYNRAFLWSIQPDGNGGALLAGYTGVQNSGSESALVLDIDSLGHIEKKFDLNYTRADHAHWFARRKTGGYFWAGHTDSESDSTGIMILMRLDDNLDSVWQKTYSYRPNSYEHAHCGTLTADGGCVLAGHTYDGTHEHTWAVRVDSNGAVIWKKLFKSSNSFDDSPYGIIMTREGNFAIFGGIDGTGFSKSRLLVVDSAGKVLVDKGYGNSNAYAFDGFQTSDGGYVVIGGEQQGATTSTALVTRTDAKGIAIWSKDFNGIANAYGYSGFQHKDQFVIVGTTMKQNADMGDFWAIYLDTNGNIVAYDTISKIGPHGFDFAMDTPTIVYKLDDFSPPSDTLYGFIKNIGDDSITVVVSASYANQWVIFASLNGKNLSFTGNDTVALAPHGSIPLFARIVPYAEQPDTEHFCISVHDLNEVAVPQEHCATLIVLPGGAGVDPQQPTPSITISPNPANTYISLRGEQMSERYQIFNAAGMLVQSGAASHEIDIRSLPTGTYEIVIGGKTRAFVVQR